MSYDIDLVHPITKKTLELDSPHHMKGGTMQLLALAKMRPDGLWEGD